MMTLMPVAAFAANGNFDYQNSYVYTDDVNADADTGEDVDIVFDFNDDFNTTTTLYVWFVKSGSSVAATGVTAPGVTAQTGISYEGDGVFKIAQAKEGDKYSFQFENTGKYTVHAAAVNPVGPGKVGTGNQFATLAEAFKNAEYELDNGVSDQNTVEITSSTASRDYGMEVTVADSPRTITLYGHSNDQFIDKNDVKHPTFYKDGAVFGTSGSALQIKANNVTEKEVTVKVIDNKGKTVKGETVTLETNSSNIELNKEKAITDQLGQIKFKVSGVRDGSYKIYVKCGSYESTILVTVGATGAYDISVVKSPSAPIDVTSDLKKKIEFTFTDANGNAVTAKEAANNGAFAAFNSDRNVSKDTVTDARQYVAIVSQPSASKLENKNLKLEPSTNPYRAKLTLENAKDLAEGTYEIKVVLDNGKYTTVKFEVKQFQTPVSMNLKYEADAVELDSYVAIDTLEWVDANGVTKDCANKVDLAATGYAVAAFATTDGSSITANNKRYNNVEAGTVFAKDDDKYVGQKITVIAVDDRYNLTAKAELTVADEASELAFDTKTLALDVNNKVGVSVVDSNGNKVALNRGMGSNSADISYVVLDKPEGSKVSVTTDNSDNNILTEGTFKMNVTANKIGNVTIQAVAKVTYQDYVYEDGTNANDTQQQVVKYYTGTQIFAVGKDSVGQVVVMSIGSSEVIVNDKKVAIDAVPMVKNDRTFVPFRALAEAFGAEVAYDEATQAITAKLNGVTVVMTIGSATYTVNGTENTMDVAPFINGSRTMVPVRFAAEAFGIKVIPTYDQNGGTADILFNL